jgi:hypothetical protein
LDDGSVDNNRATETRGNTLAGEFSWEDFAHVLIANRSAGFSPATAAVIDYIDRD